MSLAQVISTPRVLSNFIRSRGCEWMQGAGGWNQQNACGARAEGSKTFLKGCGMMQGLGGRSLAKGTSPRPCETKMFTCLPTVLSEAIRGFTLILGTPEKGTPIFGNPHLETCGIASSVRHSNIIARAARDSGRSWPNLQPATRRAFGRSLLVMI